MAASDDLLKDVAEIQMVLEKHKLTWLISERDLVNKLRQFNNEVDKVNQVDTEICGTSQNLDNDILCLRNRSINKSPHMSRADKTNDVSEILHVLQKYRQCAEDRVHEVSNKLNSSKYSPMLQAKTFQSSNKCVQKDDGNETNKNIDLMVSESANLINRPTLKNQGQLQLKKDDQTSLSNTVCQEVPIEERKNIVIPVSYDLIDLNDIKNAPTQTFVHSEYAPAFSKHHSAVSSCDESKSDQEAKRILSEATFIHKMLPNFEVSDIEAYLERCKNPTDRINLVTEKLKKLVADAENETPNPTTSPLLNIFPEADAENETPDPTIAPLLNIFPDADFKYLKKVLNQSSSIDNAVEVLLQTPNYPRKAINSDKKKKINRSSLRTLLTLFPNMEPDTLVETWFKIGHDEYTYEKFISEELDKANNILDSQTDISVYTTELLKDFSHNSCNNETVIPETYQFHNTAVKLLIQQEVEKARKEARYKTLLAVFPEERPEFLLEKCKDIGDENAFQLFINDQMEKKKKKETQYKELLKQFPETNPEFLLEVCNSIGRDENAIQSFISEQTKKNRKETECNRLLAMFPDDDPEFLRKTFCEIGDDEEAMKIFISEQMEKNKREVQSKKLIAMFPDISPQFLRDACNRIGDDEDAMEIFINEQTEKSKIEAQCQALIAMFPESDPEYLRDICFEIGTDEEELRKFIAEQLKENETEEKVKNLKILLPEADSGFLRDTLEMIGDDEVALEEFVQAQHDEVATVSYQMLVSIFPEADPEFLLKNYNRLGNDRNVIKNFILETKESGDYPTMDDYLKRQENVLLKRKYKEEFDIEDFVYNIPDPIEHFYDERNELINNRGRRFCMSYLESRYKTIPMENITATFEKNNNVLIRTCHELDNWTGETQPEREIFSHILSDEENIPIPFLQEVAFIENETKIREFLNEREERKKIAFQKAEDAGLLIECSICADMCMMSEDMCSCTNGDLFCKSCIRRGAEVAIGNGQTKVACFNDCGGEFSMKVLQMALRHVTLIRFLQRKQLEEVEAAGIEGLESCPFCNFASIPPEDDKIFKCLNPECMRESCRKCHKRNHLPLKCEEVETKDQVKMRLYIEDKMTEALIRECWKCGKKFVKEEGCNKMTCPCGAMMCYLCRQPVTDYSHFNGPGGDAYEKCELFSALEIIHDEEVKKVGLNAREEMMGDNPDLELAHDPTAAFNNA